MTSRADLAVHRRRRGAGAGRVLEAVGLGVADRVDEAQGLLELGLGLAGEADDEVAAERDVGAGGAEAVEQLQ
jgi:hypothetical protein